MCRLGLPSSPDGPDVAVQPARFPVPVLVRSDLGEQLPDLSLAF